MFALMEMLSTAVKEKVADIFILAGAPITFRKNGKLEYNTDYSLDNTVSREIIEKLYIMAERSVDKLKDNLNDDFSLSVNGLSRFRINTYMQRGTFAAVIRIIPFGIPDYRELNIPESVMNVANRNRGLVIVAGPAGGGKTTTLACIIDRINSIREGHIITLEDPIEFLHNNKKSIVSQREMGIDADSYIVSLRACIRQSPDVILVGEMRDYETIQTAITAAETGHLVISTLHTIGAANTIDRIIDIFPATQQQQIRIQLAMVLQTIISQQMIPTVDGKKMPVFEVINLNNAVRNMIRESKIHQIESIITSNTSDGMIGMDRQILSLVQKGIVTVENAYLYATNTEFMRKNLKDSV